jgi:hypothetical protein
MQFFVVGKNFFKGVRAVVNPPIIQSYRFHGVLSFLVYQLAAEAGGEEESEEEK